MLRTTHKPRQGGALAFSLKALRFPSLDVVIGIVLVVILQPMNQLFHPLREGIVTSRENTLQLTLIDGPDRVAAVVVVSAHSFHNELSQ